MTAAAFHVRADHLIGARLIPRAMIADAADMFDDAAETLCTPGPWR